MTRTEPRWYLELMKPNKDHGFVTVNDLYIKLGAFDSMLDDLAAPFMADSIDLVAGLEPNGLGLAGGLASRLRTGFLALRNSGRLGGLIDTVEFPKYKGGVDRFELQAGSITPGSRIIIVDYWIETGRSVEAAIKLVERQQGVVAGVAAICIEEGKGADVLRSRYKWATAVLPGTLIQRQCNAHSFEIDA